MKRFVRNSVLVAILVLFALQFTILISSTFTKVEAQEATSAPAVTAPRATSSASVPPDAAAQAKAVLDKEREERVKQCSKELATVLQKYNCTLSAFCYIEGGKVVTDVRVLPLDK